MKTSLSCSGVVLGAMGSWTFICPAGLLWPLQSGHNAADFFIASVSFGTWHASLQHANGLSLTKHWVHEARSHPHTTTLSGIDYILPQTSCGVGPSFICHENEADQNGEVNNATFELFWSGILKYNSKILYLSMLYRGLDGEIEIKLLWVRLWMKDNRWCFQNLNKACQWLLVFSLSSVFFDLV